MNSNPAQGSIKVVRQKVNQQPAGGRQFTLGIARIMLATVVVYTGHSISANYVTEKIYLFIYLIAALRHTQECLSNATAPGIKGSGQCTWNTHDLPQVDLSLYKS